LSVDIYGFPVPDIKANGADGPVVVPYGENLVVTIELVSGDNAEDNADWWVLAADGALNWYHWNYRDSAWLPGIATAYQGRLPEVAPPYAVLDYRFLLPGTYIFYFGVDLNRNGIINVGDLYYDFVNVTVTP
jgi:hypothetical protein